MSVIIPLQSLSAAVRSSAPDDSIANPSFRLAVDRLEELDILHRFQDGFGQRRICLTPRARRLSREELIKEMIQA